MTKNIFLIITFVSTIFFNNAQAQTIDSISVNLTKIKNSDDGPWYFSSLSIDSFSNSLLLSTLNQYWQGNHWENRAFYHRTYSASTLIQQLLQEYDSSQWVNKIRWSFNYSATIDSVLRELWNAGWNNDSLTTIYHDVNNLDSLILYQKWKASAWQNVSLSEFTYDTNFIQVSKTNSNWDTTQMQWKYTNRYVHVDSLGGTVEQSYVNGIWQNVLIRYDWGSVYGWDPSDSTFSITHGTGWTDVDSLGRVIHVYFDGTPGGYSETFYTYDSNGVLVYTFSHSESMGGLINESKRYCIYFTFPGSAIYSFAATDTVSICRNDSTQLQFFAFGGTPPLSLRWSPAAAVSNDSIECPYAFPDSTTTFVATITDSLGNSIQDSVLVRVNAIPYISSIQSIPTCPGCSTGVFIFTVSGVTGNTHYNIQPFIWPGVTYGDDTVSGLPEGAYVICVFDDNDCQSCTSDTIFSTTVAINENNREEIKLFPNPFDTQTIIYIPSSESDVILEWIDLSGKFVRTDKLQSGKNVIQKNDLPSGSYGLILLSGGKVIGRMKVVVVE